jgi:hypothetical protein
MLFMSETTEQVLPKPNPNIRRYVWLGALALAILGFIISLTAILIPSETNQAFDMAVSFTRAAGYGDDATAMSLLSPELQEYVRVTCPEESIGRCVDDYTPEDWGQFLNAVFRRAQPDGENILHIQLLATYEDNQGFSGVCVYVKTEKNAESKWQITAWSGWMSCDEPNSGLSDLISNPSVPNRAP